MKKSLLVFVLVIMCTSIFGQVKTDSIIINKVAGGYQYVQNDKVLTMTQLAMAVQSDEYALKEVNKAKSANVFGSILAYVGGYMIGYNQ